MSLFEQTLDENVAIVTMNSGENRFNFDFFNAFHEVLDELEQNKNINALVVRSSHEKIWSNGIDLEWISKKIEEHGPEFFNEFGKELYRLFNRIVTYPMITYAAITGHAFAGGAIMACAFDYRYMRNDRGWFCFPEIDIKIPFTPFLNAVALKAIPMFKLNEMQLSGERLTAEECKQYNIVKKVCSFDSLLQEIIDTAKVLNKDRTMIKTMKDYLFADIVKIYEEAIKVVKKS
ncbi:enoyl-CoA hydratase/isomerase family protein [bacterium]|nr:enoyl-CoA hydratase/isomerase family protein [bacterium]